MEHMSPLTDSVKEQLVAFFNTNMRAFERFLPDIYNKFKDYRPKESVSFVQSDLTGEVNLKLTNGSTLYPHEVMSFCQSEVQSFLRREVNYYNYAREHDKYGLFHYKYDTELFDSTPYLQNHRGIIPEHKGKLAFCVMYGIGLGYHIPELLSKVEIANLIIAEQSEDLFYSSLYTINWATVLEFINEQGMGFNLSIGTDKKDLLSDIHEFSNKYGRFLVRGYCDYTHGTGQHNSLLRDYIQDNILRVQLSLGYLDDRLFGISHAAHVLSRPCRLLKRVETGQSIDYPVFIIGSGPSLDKDLDFIAKNQDRVIIFACGSAIEILYRRGIVPDFFVTTERTYELSVPLGMFDTDFLQKVSLISSEVVHPAITALFKEHIICLKNDESIYYLLLQDRKYDDLIYAWESLHLINPLVANCALSATLALGFKDIYLFGVDNGVGSCAYENTHAKSSGLYALNLKKKDGSAADATADLDLKLEGNFGSQVKSNALFVQSACNMSILMEHYIKKQQRDFCVYNCSDGLKIDGTQPLHSADLKLQSAMDKALIKKALLEHTFVYNITHDEIKALVDNARFAQITDSITSLLMTDKCSINEVIRCMQDISYYLYQMLNTKECFYAAMIEGSIQIFFVQAQYLLYTIEDESLALLLAKKVFLYLSYLLEDAKTLLTYLPDYIQHEHLALIDNTIGFEHEHSHPIYNFKEYNIFTKDVIKRLEQGKISFCKRY